MTNTNQKEKKENRIRGTEEHVPLIHSVRIKYAASYLALITSVLLLFNLYPIAASQQMIYRSKQNSLESRVNVIASALAEAKDLSRDNTELVIDVLGSNGLNRILVTDEKGTELYDTYPSYSSLRSDDSKKDISDALDGNDIFRSDFSQFVFHSRAATPIFRKDKMIGAVYIDEWDSEQGKLLKDVQRTIQNISVVVVVASLVLSFVLSKMITSRTGELLHAIKRVREGDYGSKVLLPGQDELSEMANEFNALTDRLEETESVRRRFVSDASHELKTPLTSIGILTDSILETENIDRTTTREFVSDIRDEAKRLERITEHLLALTHFDSKEEKPRQVVEINEVIENVIHMLSPIAENTGITVESYLTPEPTTVSANRDDLYQAFYNLIENAIKYNNPGGHVAVKTGTEEGTLKIIVSDTGIGIPEEEREKVFDRFYRVDKARSRATGGTGLGLSIAHDAIVTYGGSIEIGKPEGGGTSFTVIFPSLVSEK